MKFLKNMLVMMVLLPAITFAQNSQSNSETDSNEEDVEISQEDITGENLKDLAETLPLQGTTDEGFLIIAPDNLVEWGADVIEHGFTLGATNRIGYYQPRLESKDQIIEEKDEVILNLNNRLSYYRDRNVELTTNLSNSDRERKRQEQLKEEETGRADEEEERANTWRFRFWVSTGVGAAGVGILTYILTN